MLPSKKAAAEELLKRRAARASLADYIAYTNPRYKRSWFSDTVCAAIDKFVEDVFAGRRPVLVLQAPPQHGKSEIVSRRLPAYLIGKFPDLRIGCASYSDDLAHAMGQDVRRNISDSSHFALFPLPKVARKYQIDRIGEFSSPGGDGSYIGAGVGAGITGRPLDIGIIDDPVKNQKEALSQTVKESHWSWYQSVFTTRLSENSGQIVMATSWAEDDLAGRVLTHFAGDPRLTVLKFPAINEEGETGFNPSFPRGALVPELHSLQKLRETKALFSDYWWSAMYQQTPRSLGGNVFKESGIRYYLPKDLPAKFEKVLCSWDCAFKDADGSDFVVGQVWGKAGPNVYLLDQIRARMSFTATVQAVAELKEKWPKTREILIEDKANGPAVIDTLKSHVAGIIPVEPDGSKLARAHAITSFWEAGNIFLPHQDIAPWIRPFVGEVTTFPAAANDDQVDAMTQAVRRLYPLVKKLKISAAAITKAIARR